MMLSQSWIDPRLQNLIPESLSYLVIHGELINKFWLPLTIVSNGKNTRVHTAPGTNSVLTLQQNGTVIYTIRLT